MPEATEGAHAASATLPWLDASDRHMVAIASVMIVAGIMGSWCRSFSEPQERTLSAWEVIVPGIVASFIVPLFLSLGKSDIFSSTLDGGKEFYANLLVIGGFCLLAAFSAQSFVSAMAKKAFDLASQANKTANRAEDKVDDVAEEASKNTEIISESLEPDAPAVENTSEDQAQLLGRASTDNERRVLQACLLHPGRARSRASLAAETKLSQAGTLLALTSLVGKNIVSTRKSERTGSTLFRLGPS